MYNKISDLVSDVQKVHVLHFPHMNTGIVK